MFWMYFRIQGLLHLFACGQPSKAANPDCGQVCHLDIYIYIHMYTPKLTSSHKWLCTNPFRKFVWKYKPPSWWTINFEPQKKPLRNFGEISCFSLPALVLKHYTYWCKSLVKTHLDRHCHRRILVDESPFTFGGSLASKHVQSYVCNKYLGDKGIGSPHSTWCLKQAETT